MSGTRSDGKASAGDLTEICVPGASSDHDITARCSHQLRLHDRLAEMFEHQLRAALPLLAGTYVHAGR